MLKKHDPPVATATLYTLSRSTSTTTSDGVNGLDTTSAGMPENLGTAIGGSLN